MWKEIFRFCWIQMLSRCHQEPVPALYLWAASLYWPHSQKGSIQGRADGHTQLQADGLIFLATPAEKNCQGLGMLPSPLPRLVDLPTHRVKGKGWSIWTLETDGGKGIWSSKGKLGWCYCSKRKLSLGIQKWQMVFHMLSLELVILEACFPPSGLAFDRSLLPGALLYLPSQRWRFSSSFSLEFCVLIAGESHGLNLVQPCQNVSCNS